MRIEKKALAEINRCYAVARFDVKGTPTVFFATEGEGICEAFDGPDFDRPRRVWDGPGGTMSIVPIPGRDGEFLAVQKFFKLFQWDQACIVWAKPKAGGGFEVRELLRLPYIHRFDIFASGEKLYVLACTLAESKETRDDWTKAGKIYVGELADDWDKPLDLRVLKEGLFRNHGYARSAWKGRQCGLVTSDQGAFAVLPPDSAGADWTMEQFMDWPISDIAACDIDGDGELEYATIEPWHGEYFRVWKKSGGAWEKVFEHPEVSEFYHVVVEGTLRGEPVFLGGCRRGSQHLFYLHATKKSPLSIEAVTIENGVGPSNALIFQDGDRDIIVSANREIGQAALYYVSD
ncbi:MAG TPA: hypothetical protein VIO60_07575 [Rectinemataceae bacterium]